jgi:hypothetical protein
VPSPLGVETGGQTNGEGERRPHVNRRVCLPPLFAHANRGGGKGELVEVSAVVGPTPLVHNGDAKGAHTNWCPLLPPTGVTHHTQTRSHKGMGGGMPITVSAPAPVCVQWWSGNQGEGEWICVSPQLCLCAKRHMNWGPCAKPCAVSLPLSPPPQFTRRGDTQMGVVQE